MSGPESWIEDPVERAKAAFRELLVQLGLQLFAYSIHLHSILEKIAAGDELPETEMAWLEDNELYPVLAVYCEERFLLDGLDGHLTSASKWWRKADRPDAALERAKRSTYSASDMVRSLGYTTGAAALLDMNHVPEAETWIMQAFGLIEERPHPYMVLGRLRKKQGRFGQAEEAFLKARELGAAEDDLT